MAGYNTQSQFTKVVARGFKSSEYLRHSREACEEDERNKKPALSQEDRFDMFIKEFLERQRRLGVAV